MVSEDWYFVSHRLHLAAAAVNAGYDVAVLCNLSTHKATIEHHGIRVIAWRIKRRSFSLNKEFQAMQAIRDAITSYRPDVVHAVAIKPVIYTALAAFGRKNLGLVYAFGGLGFIFSSQKFSSLLLRFIVKNILRVIFASDKARLIVQNSDDWLLLTKNSIISSRKIVLIRGAGVETDHFTPLPETLNHTHLVILPARMLWDKGVGEFVEVAKRIREMGLVARFALVGECDEENPQSIARETLESWRSSGIIEWWGRRNDMPKVYAEANIVCLPSYREGLPKALLEAASSGRAIVTFDVPGCREVVAHGENGFLVPFGDIDQLTQAVATLLQDAALRKRMGEKGRMKVLQEFSDKQIFEETLSIWDEVAR